MREATGGALMFYIIIPLILIFVVFIGFIMNYASAYRASNYIISKIESCEGDLNNCSHASYDSVKNDVSQKYHYNGNIAYCCDGNIFGVTLGVDFELPLIGKVGVYQIKSKSKIINNAVCLGNNSCEH